jgi:SAM-dependent methyltransferase
MAGTGQRFSWEEMRRYWEAHADRAEIDLDHEPDGLDNVCHTGAPPWLNQYKAAIQRIVYERLLDKVPPPPIGACALDIGCGAGRWCRVLDDRGYLVTGIDLQSSLIEEDRVRNPGIEFRRASIQEFTAPEPFDLVSSVTVLQHIPPDEQPRAVGKLAEMLRSGGHAVILENIHDQGVHVFANSIEGWVERFRRAGFELIQLQRYDYSPGLRIDEQRRRRASRRRSGGLQQAPLTPETYRSKDKSLKRPKQKRPLPRPVVAVGRIAPSRQRDLERAYRRVAKRGRVMSKTLPRRVAVSVDRAIEPYLVRANLPLPTHHCGLLFRLARS